MIDTSIFGQLSTYYNPAKEKLKESWNEERKNKQKVSSWLSTGIADSMNYCVWNRVCLCFDVTFHTLIHVFFVWPTATSEFLCQLEHKTGKLVQCKHEKTIKIQQFNRLYKSARHSDWHNGLTGKNQQYQTSVSKANFFSINTYDIYVHKCHASFSPVAFFDKFDKVIKSWLFFLSTQPSQSTAFVFSKHTGLHSQKKQVWQATPSLPHQT
jgi:hypothetical protein